MESRPVKGRTGISLASGRSCFEGRQECNDFSIGIELEGADEVPFTEDQYRTLAATAHDIMAAWPEITPDRVTGHSDIAPGRKTDPGPAFDWPRFHGLLIRHRAHLDGSARQP